MSFGLKNAGATYMRAMTTIFHDMIHKEIELYVDGVIIKSKKATDHMQDLRKFYNRLKRYNLKLNPAKCAFGVPARKLLGFIMLKKDAATEWTDDCQKSFNRIKEYQSTPPLLVPPEPEEADGKPWFHDIKEYLVEGEYPELANANQKRMLQRLSNNFFHDGGILYMRTPDLGLLRCVDVKEASRLLEKIHVGTCSPHMNGFVLAKKILRAGYFWMKMEIDYIQYVRKCHHYQIHADMIKVHPNELNATSSLWSFATWGMDVIGPIEPTALNEHMFILVAIYYFTKWVEAASYRAVTKKVMADFASDKLESGQLCYGARLQKAMDEGRSLGLLCEEKEVELTHWRYEAYWSSNYESYLMGQLQKKTEDLESLRGEVDRVSNDSGKLRAQVQVQASEEKGALAKVPAFDAQLHLARDNASVQVDMITKLESELSNVRVKIVDARAEATLSRTKAYQEMAIHLKDGTDAQVELKRALDREEKIEEYVCYRSRRRVLEEIGTRGLVLQEELARARTDERDARSLLSDTTKSKDKAGTTVGYRSIAKPPETPSTVAPETAPPTEWVPERSSNDGSVADPAIMKMPEDLTKRIESGEKMIAANDKKVETYNFRVDEIPGVPPVLKGVDSRKFVQWSFPEEAAPKPIPKKFRMPELPK
ncbi:uncharacterized protein [Nicotiana sylvestris]|uniref:uncharacterized protein n=1 Tax=Nicotiana sylvestris TaxID=4096 RepID=UPI00388C943C